MSLLRDYADQRSQPTLLPEPAASFDEVVDVDGRVRPAWRELAGIVTDLSTDDLQSLATDAAELLADDGADYGRPGAEPQPWRLDPIPLIVDGAEWETLEKGLAQRADLLSAVLDDLYGPQRLLSEGVVPAAAVFAHRRFLQPLMGAARGDDLVLTGCDLGRHADGTWRVFGDRVQAPSGLGFAMENRRVMTRLLPTLHRETRAHRTEPFVTTMRTALLHSGPDTSDSPRAVVLSPGARSETAFDQAFLANVLGFPLVRGGDLVVHDDHVWMKPVGWPRAAPVDRVDVIIRRVDADWCDPLELRGESQLGVPGLVEVSRRGNVRIANGLGTGVLENPALFAYMPQICRFLLDEDLLIDVADTWWCGDLSQREEVLRLLDDDRGGIILQRIDGSRVEDVGLTSVQWRERILSQGHLYAAQRRLSLSRLPVLDEHVGVDSRPVTLRAFTVRDGAAQRAFVGGLATLAEHDAIIPVNKDVWVIKASADAPDQGIDKVVRSAFARAMPVFAPRALDDMFWAGRYAERAEDLVRIVTAIEAFSRGMRRIGDAEIDPLAATATALAGIRYTTRSDELRSLLIDTDRPGSVADALHRLREAFMGVRDQLSDDTWRVFAATDRMSGSLRSDPLFPVSDAASRMLTGLLSLYGVTASMMRDDGWHAFEAGRHLERGMQVCTLVRASLPSIFTDSADDALRRMLTAAESIVTYRRRYGGVDHPADALELLLGDPDNPRSLASTIDAVGEHLSALPLSSGSTRPERLVAALATKAADARTIRAPQELATFLDDTMTELAGLSNAIALVHFQQGPMPRAIHDAAQREDAA
ncbi:MAG: circularly permuted type 2 ATP-grasp protein [Microbacterium sp.]